MEEIKMIDCLNMKNLDYLYWIASTANEVEKYFNKLCKKNDILGPITLKIFNKDELLEDELKSIERTIGPDWEKSSLAITISEFMVLTKPDEDPTDDKIVQRIDSNIFIPFSTISKIAERSGSSSRNRKFCVRYILRHEFGHIKSFHELLGKPLRDVNQTLHALNNERENWYKNCTYDGMVKTLDQWLMLNSITVESEANKYAHIKHRELVRFFKIIGSL